MKKFCVLILVTVLVLCVSASAQTIHARFGTTAYTWQEQIDDSSSASHLRAYQLAQISIGNIGTPKLSFHSYIQLAGDLLDEADDDPRVWIYNFYFNYRQLVDKLDVSVGRQRIYAGVGYGTIDGFQAQYTFRDYFKLKAYAGTLAPLRKSYEVEDMNSDNMSWGFHLTSSKINKLRLGISYAQHSRSSIQYKNAGIYSGTFRLDNPVSSLQRKLIGFDVQSHITQKLKLNGRLDYNLAIHNVKRGQIGGRYSCTNKFEIGLDYIYRTPFIDLNSIFWVFALNPNSEVSFHANYRLNQNRFFVNFAQVMFDGDDNQRIGFGWSWKTLYLGYNRRAGYGGDSNGLVMSYQYQVMERLSVVLNSNILSYDRLSADSELALAGVAGFNYRTINNLTLQTEVQFLRNLYFGSDVRFFFRGNYAFSHRFGQ